MFSYKNQRLVLIVFILTVLYLLFLRWNDFQEQAKKSDQAANANSTTQQAVNKSSSDALIVPDDTPVIATSNTTQNNNTADNGSVPVVPANHVAPTTKVTQNTAQAIDPIITVTTDVMQVKINLNGGDLVGSELLNYKESMEKPTNFIILTDKPNKTYVVSSGFIGKNGADSKGKRALYTSEQTSYKLVDNELVITLVHTNEISTLKKILRFTRGSYKIDQTFSVTNNQASGNINLATYTQIKRNMFEDPNNIGGLGVNSYLGPAFSTQEDSYAKYTFEDMQSQNLNQNTKNGWLAMLQHYFATAIIPNKDMDAHFYSKYTNNNAIFGYISPSIAVASGDTTLIDTSIYLGPKIKKNLESAHENLPLTIDYGWFWFISEILIWMLLKIQLVFVNWGLSIIALTVVVRLIFFWPTKSAFYSMAKMRLAMPEIEAIKSRAGDDKQAMSKEMMAFYKEKKLNPLGGCLPMLLQMPVFIALYWGLLESVEIRHTSFMLWITDLSASDPYFVLPILMGITFYLQQKFNPQSATMDPTMQQVLKYMPVLFTFLFLWLPSGLVLYFVTSNIWSIAQQLLISKQLESKQNH